MKISEGSAKITAAPTFPCPKCAGVGKLALNKFLLETLQTVKKLRGATAKEIHFALNAGENIHTTAINNRLEDLRALGLVIRNRSEDGKSWVYSPAPKSAK